MSIVFSGSCICGAVRYECTAEPLAMYDCHCHACQRTSGAPFSSLVVARTDAMTIEGSPLNRVAPAPGGSDHMQYSFCGTCGSALFARNDARPDILLIKAPSLSDPSLFQPIADIWTISMRPWTVVNTRIPKVYRSPPLFRKENVTDL